MRRCARKAFRRVLTFGLWSLAALSAMMPARAGQLDALAWLAGCWASEAGEAGSGEYWLPQAGGVMLGIGRLVHNGIAVDHEFLRLEEDSAGRAVYTAIPAGQAQTSFVASHVGETTAIFENPSHDFPQKIIYDRVEAQRLTVRIEGGDQDEHRVVEFRFIRATCEK